MKQRGFSLFEAVLAMALFLVGALLVTEALTSSEGAARADHAKSRSIRDNDTFLRRLGLELAQTTAKIDNDLPPGENQRLWLVANGVRFQKVVGHTINADGTVSQQWSPDITYTWDQPSGQVTRVEAGQPPRVIARRVINFAVATSAGGQVTVAMEPRSGAVNRGEDASHRQTIRVTPRNDLK